MKVEDIIKLIDAGYSKKDIEAMAQDPAEPAKPAAEEAAADQAPATSPAGSEQQDTAAVNAAMLQELRDMKKAIFAMNIMNSEQPATSSVDDILAKFTEIRR